MPAHRAEIRNKITENCSGIEFIESVTGACKIPLHTKNLEHFGMLNTSPILMQAVQYAHMDIFQPNVLGV